MFMVLEVDGNIMINFRSCVNFSFPHTFGSFAGVTGIHTVWHLLLAPHMVGSRKDTHFVCVHLHLGDIIYSICRHIIYCIG